ncbi:MAG: FecR domain-containing protein, partial [Bacteroidota bacterium]|nr:FecR domain-containing protein [Bacteroidota bacterium]
MNYEKYKNYSTEEFILDEVFMQWVLHPNQENDIFWKEFLQNHPEKIQQVKEAVFMIKAIRAVEPSISRKQLDQVYENVHSVSKPTRKIGWMVTKIAAVFLLLVSIGGLLYYLQDTKNTFPVELATNELLEKGRVIMPDGTVSEFESEHTQIKQTASGDLTINNDTVSVGDFPAEAENQTLAQIIIPYGKRSEITLSDGTKIWLNSGSQLSYPVSFTGRSREVYLSGEAYFDVESDPAKPFHVITDDMKIRVTGTKFNVTSYANDQTTQAVLITGKIDAARNKRFARSVELQPGERVIYNKQEDNMEKNLVDVELYSSWVNGYLVFDNEPVENIFKKLERYYNKNILTEKLSGQPTFTGKLDLADDLEKVLKNIAFSASFSVVFENGTYIIKPKKP